MKEDHVRRGPETADNPAPPSRGTLSPKKEWARNIQKATPTDHGRALGDALANLCDTQAVILTASGVVPPERCATCAFRHGTQANGYAATLLQAMHCVLGTDPSGFACHQTLNDDGIPTALCAGYLICQTAEFADVKSAIAVAADNLDRVCPDAMERARNGVPREVPEG